MKCWNLSCKKQLEFSCPCKIPPVYSCDSHISVHLKTKSKSGHHPEPLTFSPSSETKRALIDFLHQSLSDLYELRRKTIHDYSMQIKQVNEKMKITLQSFDLWIKEQRKIISQINLVEIKSNVAQTKLNEILFLKPEESIKRLIDRFNIFNRSLCSIDNAGKLIKNDSIYTIKKPSSLVYDNPDPWGVNKDSSAKPVHNESKDKSLETPCYTHTEQHSRRGRYRRITENASRGESRGQWKDSTSSREESRGQQLNSKEPRYEEPSTDPWYAKEPIKEQSKYQPQEPTDNSEAGLYLRGLWGKRYRGEGRKFKSMHISDEKPREILFQPWEIHDHPQEVRKSRPYKDTPRKKFPKWGEFEKVKIKRRRFFEKIHNKDILYKEEDEQFDPETHYATTHFRDNKDWDELPIPQNLLGAIEQAGFPFPTKIQNFGIEVILKEGYENLLAQAPFGSGKTATFVIGSLCRVDLANPQTQVICINHTIELANQNYQEYKQFADPCGISVAVLSKGGERIDGQVLVASSGSFFKALKTKSISLEELKVLVMDEADLILNKKDNSANFSKVEEFIKTGFPKEQVQVLLFSATYTDTIKTDIVELLGNLNEITIKKEDSMLDTIDHYYFRTPQATKIDTFEQILRKITSGVSIAFVNTCNFARTVYGVVSKKEWKCALLMGQDMTVDERNLIMNDINEGKYATLITTNLLARDIDSTKVKCVVNFDVPRIPKSRDIDDALYLNRSSRCFKFGRHGVCISLVTTDEELATLKTLEDSYNMEIVEVASLDDFDAIVGAGEKATEETVRDL